MEKAVIAQFRRLIDMELQQFLNASEQFGEPIFGLAEMVYRAFRLLEYFIIDGVRMERPDEDTIRLMAYRVATEIQDIQSFRNRNRHIQQEVFNHLSTVSESVVALNWITASTNPVKFVHHMWRTGEYFGDMVLSQYKGNQLHQEWINKWNQVLAALETYVRTYHPTGFNWNVLNVPRVSGHSIALSVFYRHYEQNVPPPPPPPIRPPARVIPEGGDNRQNLWRDLNQGVGIVRMLKPVYKEQPSLSQQSLPSTSGENLPITPAAVRTYPPKLLLDGPKWRVEHQKDRYDLVIDSAEMSHSLSVFECQNIHLEVRNKLNCVTIDNCKNATVAVRDIISSVELIGCQNTRLQCVRHVPLIIIHNCDWVDIFLTNKSLDAEIFSSKSSSLFTFIVKDCMDYLKMAVPEQIKTVVVDGKLESTTVENNK